MASLLNSATSYLSWAYNSLPELSTPKEVEKIIVKQIEMARPNVIYRVAGLSGAMAVAMGAYGAHVFRPSDVDPRLKETFETGYRMHLIHSVALMGTTMAHRPLLVGSLMSAGIVLFSGSCYYHAMTGNTSIRYVTPYGGMLLIASWLAMML